MLGVCVGPGGCHCPNPRTLCPYVPRQLLAGAVQPAVNCGFGAGYGTVFKVQDFNTYVVYLGIGLVVWNGISSAIGSAPNLFEHNQLICTIPISILSFMCWRNGPFRSRLSCSRLPWW